jgi:hypothetical protein
LYAGRGGSEVVFEVAQIFEKSDFSDFFNNPANDPPKASNKTSVYPLL